MAAQTAVPQTARPWNPEFTHSDRERWICIYPTYINSKRTLQDGRRIPTSKAVDNPTYAEIKDVIAAAGLTMGVENKVYPRELDHRDPKCRGRIRVQLKNDDGSIMNEKFPDRKSILLYLAETIPKLKSRQSSSQASSQSQPSKNQKRKGKKGR
ncbi:hypothetical protein LOTGIDRAFT_215214 [Lottia gigantea]|uniref:Signal recognition particle 19 kDa protein n=1 Tax=Lottia gigantea TaxID=225164 RepID=V4AK08_LOTGI|nr:hypothetical protein LOTGIDRAFT_215214 [Lottia gigantea]ESO95065.1 hypothetical protein LOTGIDRAFT_215214 [Lottia gigantea]